jgi:hypothetical protein
MAKVIVIGVEGEEGLWLADLAAGTVVPLQPPATGELATVSDLRKSGSTVVKGVDLAVAVSAADKVFAGLFDA